MVPSSRWLWRRSTWRKHSPSVPSIPGPTDGSSEMKSHETLRFFEIDVYDLVNGALNCDSLLNQTIPLVTLQSKVPAMEIIIEGTPSPRPWALYTGDTPHSNVVAESHGQVRYGDLLFPFVLLSCPRWLNRTSTANTSEATQRKAKEQ